MAARTPRRLLVVDDDSDIAGLIERWLRDLADVTVAHSAAEAVRLAKSCAPDVVLADFNMPEHTGGWLLEQASTQWPLARRVLMSGGEASAFESGLQSGLFQAFIRKPLSRSTLVEALGLVGSTMDLAREKASERRLAAMLDKSPADLVAELSIAMDLRETVVVLLRGDPLTGRPVRSIEGVPIEFRPTADGRERVVLLVEPDIEQLVVIDRIARVRRIRAVAASD